MFIIKALITGAVWFSFVLRGQVKKQRLSAIIFIITVVADVSGIKIEGENKWKTLIENASMKSLSA